MQNETTTQEDTRQYSNSLIFLTKKSLTNNHFLLYEHHHTCTTHTHTHTQHIHRSIARKQVGVWKQVREWKQVKDKAQGLINNVEQKFILNLIQL